MIHLSNGVEVRYFEGEASLEIRTSFRCCSACSTCPGQGAVLIDR